MEWTFPWIMHFFVYAWVAISWQVQERIKNIKITVTFYQNITYYHYILFYDMLYVEKISTRP